MNAVLMITTLLCLTLQSVLRKNYSKKVDGKGVYTYTTLAGVGTLAFFLLTAKDLHFNLEILPYSIWFAVSYILAGVAGLKAIAVGSLSLTSLVTNCALILPTLYGLIFLKEPADLFLYSGMALLVAALVLVNKSGEKSPITGKWMLWAMLSFLGNGMCSVSQKVQQDAFAGAGKNELMIFALVIVIAVNAVLAITAEKREIRTCIKNGWSSGLIAGAANGVVNLFVMIMVGRMPASMVFPLITGGSIVLTHFVSKIFYKEQLSKRQTLGFLLGVASIIFLNL